MSEQSTGAQLERAALDDAKTGWNVVSCQDCDWTGAQEDLTIKLTNSFAGLKVAEIYVCPECGSENIEGEL